MHGAEGICPAVQNLVQEWTHESMAWEALKCCSLTLLSVTKLWGSPVPHDAGSKDCSQEAMGCNLHHAWAALSRA